MNKIQSILIAIVAVVCALAFVGCGDDKPPEETKYKITLTQSNDYTLTSNMTEGVFGDTVTINVELKNFEKKLTAVTYRSETKTDRAIRQSDKTFAFILTKAVTVSAVLEDYVEVLATDSSSRPFATFSSSNTKTLVPNSGSVGLYIPLNASYMTILNYKITSSNQSVIPNDAFTLNNRFQSQSNIIIGTNLVIDTTKIHIGTTWITIDLSNGNTTSQKGSLVVKLTVAESIDVETWTETVIFDTSNLPTEYKNQETNFYIAFLDQDYITGMNVQDFIKFENQKINNGKISITLTYAVGHKYYVSFGAPDKENPEKNVWFTLLESVGNGSTSTGFNQYKNGNLSFIQKDSTLTIIATYNK